LADCFIGMGKEVGVLGEKRRHWRGLGLFIERMRVPVWLVGSVSNDELHHEHARPCNWLPLRALQVGGAGIVVVGNRWARIFEAVKLWENLPRE